MHHLATRTFIALATVSLAYAARVPDNEQTVLSQGSQWSVNDGHDGDDSVLFNMLDTTHPIPPGRGHGTDAWNLSSLSNTTYHDTYHPLFEINEFMEHLAALYPDQVNIFELGHTAQGREMFAIRISGGVPVEDEEEPRPAKKGFVISGAQHAREWVASAAALYLAHALVSNSSEPNSLSHLLHNFDFHIIPVPNPDGYVFTWENDRMWYKNRMPVGPNEPCQGLDMNRNWGFHWSPSDYLDENEFEFEDYGTEAFDALNKKKGGKKGKGKPKPKKPAPTPADPCSHWFPGHRPYEAPEVNNIANYIMQTPDLKAFMDLRSYGQMLSWPYSYSCDTLPADAEDLFEAALGAAHEIRKKHGTVYTTGRLCSTLYPAPGNILDWMYGAAGIKYSYAAHLRDTGTYGYSLPREWIRPVGEETGTMVEYIAKFATSQK